MKVDLLREGLERLEAPHDEETIGKLETFISEIELFNPAYKLVACADRDELVIRHILDSAAAWKVVEEAVPGGSVLADLGSGAGFPGIVLAILLPGQEVHLIERMGRRVQFLGNAVLRCNLGNVSVVSEDVGRVKATYGALTCRAFHPLADCIGDVDRLLAPGGAFVAYKGQQARVEAELALVPEWDAEIRPLRVPFLDEPRRAVVLRRKGEVK